MKQIAFIMLLALYGIATHAQQMKFSGKIKNMKNAALTIFLLEGSIHFRNQAIPVQVNADGSFSQSIQLAYPALGLLKFDAVETKLLLSPGRDLHLEYDVSDHIDRMHWSGTAANENKLLRNLQIGSRPFFLEENWQENKYAKLSLDSLQTEVLNVLRNDIKSAEKKVAFSELPGQQQFILLQELKYSYQCYLYDLANNMRWSKNQDFEKFQELLLEFLPMPGSATLMSSVYANMMLDHYPKIKLEKLGKELRSNAAKAKAGIQQVLHIPFDTLITKFEKYGEDYVLPWQYAKYNMPESIHDKILFNKIMQASNSGETSMAAMVFDTLQRYYPYSHYLPAALKEVKKMQVQVNKQQQNPAIVLNTTKKIKSLKELVAPYTGKIVYLDIWGTWCPPCKEEMRHTAALKKRYAGKEIAFIYLDMDDDRKEEAWKEYVYLMQLEGDHYRLNNEQIQSCWKEIEQAGGRTNIYPTFVLFDTQGNIITANAERPSSGEKLYQQLDKAL